MSSSSSSISKPETRPRSSSSQSLKSWAIGSGPRPKVMTPAKGTGGKVYAVKVGRSPGIYDTVEEADAQVHRYPGAVHKSFDDIRDALRFIGEQDTSKPSWFEVAAFPSPRQNRLWSAYLDILHEQRKVPTLGEIDPNLPGPSGIDIPPDGVPGPSDLTKINLATITAAPEPEPVLTAQQSEILDRIMKGQNFFFTGSAGTGKSVLLRAIIQAFRNKTIETNAKEKGSKQVLSRMLGDDEATEGPLGVAIDVATAQESEVLGFSGRPVKWKLAVTASTGMAGVNIGGSTLHSWAGVGLGKMDPQNHIAIIKRDIKALERWLTTSALIIDEISMIDGFFLDKLDAIGRTLRRDSRPFGGIQMILSGDFFQLPPVGDDHGTGQKIYKFAFEADCWDHMIPRSNIVGLTRVFRQNDDRFVKILEGMRKGLVQENDMQLLKTLARPLAFNDGIEAVELRAVKREVEEINRRRLTALKSPLIVYQATDRGGMDSKGRIVTKEAAIKKLDQNTTWPKELSVKVGAAVMLLTNLKVGGLVNGSIGKIVEFVTLVQAADRKIQIPSLRIQPSLTQPYPVVEFIPSKHATKEQLGKGGSVWLIPAMQVEVNNAQGEVEAERTQIPLMLAWALTVHKAQGQTLERVKIDLKSAFSDGQAYVAISRATSLEGLELRNFSHKSVMTSQRVLQWALPIEEAQKAEEDWEMLLANADMDI